MSTPARVEAGGERHELIEVIAGMWDDYEPDAQIWLDIQRAISMLRDKPENTPGENSHARGRRTELLKQRKRLRRAIEGYQLAYMNWWENR
jgi:hypothetical protein